MEAILSALHHVLPQNRNVFGLHEPSLNGNEWEYLKECLDSGWVSSVGKYVDRFEKQLAEYTGAHYAAAVVNGTAALHTSLELTGVSAGDEVLVPALSFVSTANAVRYCGAVPHFVDSEERTLGLNPYKLAEYLKQIAELRQGRCFNKNTKRCIKAVVPMHTFGHSVDMDPLLAVCQRYGLEIIEDAAESLGSYYKNRHTGSWGRFAVLSFNGNKIVTTGGGGAILTNDEKLHRLAKHITTQAKIPHPWLFNHDRTGYNYRMPNINAALGCAQLERLPEFLIQKRALFKKYQEAFAEVEGVVLFQEPAYACSNYWLNVLLLAEEYCGERDKLLKVTHEQGIMTRPAWTLLSKLPMYTNCPRMDLSGAESLERRIINIPSSAFLGNIQ